MVLSGGASRLPDVRCWLVAQPVLSLSQVPIFFSLLPTTPMPAIPSSASTSQSKDLGGLVLSGDHWSNALQTWGPSKGVREGNTRRALCQWAMAWAMIWLNARSPPAICLRLPPQPRLGTLPDDSPSPTSTSTTAGSAQSLPAGRRHADPGALLSAA